MALFRTLTADGDMTFGKGLNNFSRDNNAIKLDILTKIRSWKNDCFFALNDGVDWFNRLGSKGQQQLLEQEIRQIILSIEDVVAINQLELNTVNRKISINMNISTKYSKEYRDLIEETI